jgi:hypothetical protein
VSLKTSARARVPCLTDPARLDSIHRVEYSDSLKRRDVYSRTGYFVDRRLGKKDVSSGAELWLETPIMGWRVVDSIWSCVQTIFDDRECVSTSFISEDPYSS